jgi:hypothetical protein
MGATALVFARSPVPKARGHVTLERNTSAAFLAALGLGLVLEDLTYNSLPVKTERIPRSGCP